MYIGLHVNYPSFFSDFSATLIFFHRFSQNPQISNFTKIRLVENELFYQTDGRTYMMKLVVAFLSFVKAPTRAQ